MQCQRHGRHDAGSEEGSVRLRSPAAPKGGAEEKSRVTPLPSRSLRASRMTGLGERYALEEAGLAAGWFALKVFVGARSGYAAARGAIEHANLHEVGLVHFFDGIFFFAEGGG